MNEQHAWDLARWDAMETADRVRRREVSAAEVVEAAIVRAERARPLNAIVTATFDRARAEAGRGSTGAFGVVPSFIKDLTQVEGVRTTWGSAASGTFISKTTDDSAKAFARFGLISLGKSATPEFGLTGTTEPLAFGACHNPWDETRTPGGSSGGAAALVASGVVPIAHASDGGGSIRIPASCCGLVGLKVTRGRFDLEGSQVLPVRAIVHGVVTRSLRDTVTFWQALDRAQPAPNLPRLDDIARAPRRPLRIHFSTTSPASTPIDAEVRAALDQTARQCEALGHHVEQVEQIVTPADLEDFASLWAFLGFMQTRLAKVLLHRDFDPALLEPWSQQLAVHFAANKLQHLWRIRRLRQSDQGWLERMGKADVTLTPTIATLPPKLGYLRTDQNFELLRERVTSTLPFTAPFNASGAPALSLPLGRSREGLPIGMQFGSRHGSEALLLELGLQLEAAHPWPQLSPRFLG